MIADLCGAGAGAARAAGELLDASKNVCRYIRSANSDSDTTVVLINCVSVIDFVSV